MYRHLNLGHSLYIITPEILEEFLTLSDMYKMDGHVASARSTSQLDSYAIVFHIWCLLNDKEYNLFFDLDKILIYSIDYYLLNLIRQNPQVKRFIESRNTTQAFKFILAYHIACASLNWGDMVILNSEKGKELCEENNSRNYFLLASQTDLNPSNNIDFYLFQKEIIHLFATNYVNTNEFNEYINHSISLARIYRNRYL